VGLTLSPKRRVIGNDRDPRFEIRGQPGAGATGDQKRDFAGGMSQRTHKGLRLFWRHSATWILHPDSSRARGQKGSVMS
jgi:hypothetical protein